MNEKKDIIFMQEAITLAKQAEIEGEVPDGALDTLEGKVIGRGYNQMIQNSESRIQNYSWEVQNSEFPFNLLNLINLLKKMK